MSIIGYYRGILYLIVMFLIVAGILVGSELDFGPEPPPMEGDGAPTVACGDFDFKQYPRDTYFRNGIIAELDFQFDATRCTTRCDSIGFIQIVRTIDLDNPDEDFYYPSLQKKQRATKQGWYIDRGEGYKWVYYGRKNNKKFQDYVTVGKGSNSMRANMIDRPYRPENHPYLGIRWQAVTVPICIDADTTGHGYLAWSWTVTSRGEVKDVKEAVAKKTLKDEVVDAVAKWNDDENVKAWRTEKFLKVTVAPPTSTRK